MHYLNVALKLLAYALLAIIAVPVVIMVVTVISIVWAVEPWAGMALLAFCLLLIRLWFYIE